MYRIRAHSMRIPILALVAASSAATVTPTALAADDPSLAAVVVTATRNAISIDSAPGVVSLVTRASIEARGVQNLQDAINTLPGVFVRPGRGISDVQQSISLHGTPDEKRTLVLIDGQQVNDSYAGGLSLGGLSLDMIERVEVSQGPGSALYGGNSVGGVVHYITRMPSGPEGRLRMGYGDAAHRGEAPAGTRWLSLSGGTRFSNGLAVLIGAGYRATNGYPSEWATTTTAPPAAIRGALMTSSNTGGTSYVIGHRGANRWADESLTLRAALPLSKGDRLTVGFMRQRYDYDFGDPVTYLSDAAGNPVYTYVNGATVRANAYNASYGSYLRDLWQVGYETSLGGGDLKIAAGYATTPKSWYVTASGSDAAFNTTTLSGGPGRVARGDSSSWNVDAQWTVVHDAHQLTLGTAFRQEQASNGEVALGNWKDPASLGAEVSQTRGRNRTMSFFVQDEWRMRDSTTAWVGVRWDHWRTFDGFTWNSLVAAPFNQAQEHSARSAAAISPKVALVHRLTPDLSIKASVGQAFRPPNVYELYRTFKIGSLATVYQNNTQLLPEKSTSTDLGVELKPWAGGKISVNVFHNRFTDLIYTAGAGNPRQRVNAGLATSQGLQLSFEQKLSTDTRLFLNATEQQGTILSNTASPTAVGKDMTWMPKRMANLGLETRHGAWNASATVRHATRQFSLDNNTDTVSGVYGSYDGYTLADVRLAYRLSGGSQVGFAIDNLTDRRYFSNYPAPGRSWMLDLSMPF